MLLVLRDEDIETVGSAVTAIALQHGLEPAAADEQAQDILALAAALLGPRVVLSAGEDFVLAEGLASLDVGVAWGAALSAACGNEVVAIEPAPNGIRVTTFDDGEEDEAIDVDVDPSGTTRSEALADIAPSDEAADELRRGVPAQNAIDLAMHVLRLMGAGEELRAGEPVMLAFQDPRADEDDDA
ncbi:MAG TPA: hypothetical protein VIF62_00510 [Labilithrix sp.]|jgi:hypothetical protein